MFDIPELDGLISQKLGRRDLAQCARVCKRWYRIVVPYIWRELSFMSFSIQQQAAFVQLVVDDYLQERQHQRQQKEGYSMDQWLPLQPSRPLARYGHLVQRLTCSYVLEQYFEEHSSRLREQVPDGYDILSKSVIMEHLYKQCPNFRNDIVTILTKDLGSILTELARKYILPRTRCLVFYYNAWSITSLKLKALLNVFSALEDLTLSVNIHDDVNESEKDLDQEVSESWKLRRLRLKHCSDKSNNKVFWPWLWKRCLHVDSLEVDNIWDGISQHLVDNGIAYMSKLNKIHIGESLWTGEMIEALLSVSYKWEEVSLGFDGEAFSPMAHLMMHSLTLERIALIGNCGVTHTQKAPLLACCPNLRDYTDIDKESSPRRRSTGFNAHTFIDQDPDAGYLKRWECEASLKVFKANIAGIPRPDLDGNKMGEVYPGQGRDIQSQVYDRLARFINLETLWLGVGDWNDAAVNCLEMSLESGLDKISGLKALKELDVSGMKTRIGENEVRWMAEQWPKLHTIRGLMWWGSDKEAVKWLKHHHPEISWKQPRTTHRTF
jgi:hypothetical protein